LGIETKFVGDQVMEKGVPDIRRGAKMVTTTCRIICHGRSNSKANMKLLFQVYRKKTSYCVSIGTNEITNIVRKTAVIEHAKKHAMIGDWYNSTSTMLWTFKSSRMSRKHCTAQKNSCSLIMTFETSKLNSVKTMVILILHASTMLKKNRDTFGATGFRGG